MSNSTKEVFATLASRFAPNTIVDLGERGLKLSGSKLEHKYTLKVDVGGLKISDVISTDMAVRFANNQRGFFKSEAEASAKLDGKTLALKYSDLTKPLGSAKPISKTRIAHYKELVDSGVVTAEQLVESGHINSVSDVA